MDAASAGLSLSIIVYRGNPVDASEYRHTALLLEDADGTSTLLQVGGAHGFFATETLPRCRPSKNPDYLAQIAIATPLDATLAALRESIQATPVNNMERAWNCHNWVGDALNRLGAARCISSSAKSEAIARMVELIVDAPDQVIQT